MAKSVNISKYDPGMMDLLEAVCESGKPCPITYPDEKTAKKERFEFYGLIRAIKVQNHSLAPKAALLVFSISGPGRNVLTISIGNPVQSTFYTQIAERLLGGQ